MFAYESFALEFMLVFDKMQNTSPSMCIKFEIFESYSSFAP